MLSSEELLNMRYEFLNDIMGMSKEEAEVFDFDGELFHQTFLAIFEISDITLHKEETDYERMHTGSSKLDGSPDWRYHHSFYTENTITSI